MEHKTAKIFAAILMAGIIALTGVLIYINSDSKPPEDNDEEVITDKNEVPQDETEQSTYEIEKFENVASDKFEIKIPIPTGFTLTKHNPNYEFELRNDQLNFSVYFESSYSPTVIGYEDFREEFILKSKSPEIQYKLTKYNLPQDTVIYVESRQNPEFNFSINYPNDSNNETNLTIASLIIENVQYFMGPSSSDKITEVIFGLRRSDLNGLESTTATDIDGPKLLSQPQIQAARDNFFDNSEARTRFNNNFQDTPKGLSVNISDNIVTETFIILRGCMPGDCADNEAVIMYNNDYSKLFLIMESEYKGQIILELKGKITEEEIKVMSFVYENSLKSL